MVNIRRVQHHLKLLLACRVGGEGDKDEVLVAAVDKEWVEGDGDGVKATLKYCDFVQSQRYDQEKTNSSA